jgi:branched-chain amino acid transport system ATP-binding protein
MSILTVAGVTRRFGGLKALTDVNLELSEGEILGLIGPNGAGKTTLFNVINGIYPPSEGRITFRDRDITGRKPYDVARLGIARTHQVVRPLNELTVRENVMTGACFGRENRNLQEAGEIADQVMAFVGLVERSQQLAGSLNVAEKKRLELARALAARPYLLLLDEVLAGLNQSEIDVMIEAIRAVRGQGVAIIIIEHVMRATMSLSDRLIVLDHGEPIAEGAPTEIMANQRVIEAYLGDPKLAKRLMGSEQDHGDSRGPRA